MTDPYPSLLNFYNNGISGSSCLYGLTNAKVSYFIVTIVFICMSSPLVFVSYYIFDIFLFEFLYVLTYRKIY